MKIEKINDNKIKITLDINDLKTRNIDVKSFIHNSPESQDLFWDVMQEAENKYGFSVEESMVYVEAHANENGLFTLIVTKTAQTPDNTFARARKNGFNFKLKRKTNSYLTPEHSIFKFKDVESLVNFTNIANKDVIGFNTLYEYNNSYYLVVDKASDYSIFEYASKEPNYNLTKSKLCEYGKVLYENDAINSVYKITHT